MAGFWERPERQPDYHLISAHRPLVMDNGSCHFRVGWAGEHNPRLQFRNILNKPRQRSSGEIVNIVGDFDPGFVKYFDFARTSFRTPFDGNVVFQYETMESILDYAFERMGIQGNDKVDHPVLMTECPGNPLYCRSKMAELLFEAYRVPSVAFGVDGVFSYAYNQNRGTCSPDGLVVSSGHMATHVIPMVRGEPIMEAVCRISVGGYHITDYFKRLLSLQHPFHVNSMSWEKIEELKQEHCYIADDYHSELGVFVRNGQEAEQKTRSWQLPFVPVVEKEPISEEELARKAAVREKQGQRLREMAAAKRTSKIADLEAEVQGLESMLQELDGMDDVGADYLLSESGYSSREDLRSALSKASTSLQKAKGKPVELEKEKTGSPSDKYPLLDIPNSLLTAEQLKEKKRQRFLKMTSEGRARAKLRRQEEGLQKEREQQLDEERRLANPEQYLEELRSRHADLAIKAEQRKRQKTKLITVSGSIAPVNLGLGGRGERLSAVQKERMKLLTTAAFDRGKEEDTFGMRDEDWQLYKRMGKDGDDDDGAEEDDAELARTTARLQEIDPSFVPNMVGPTQGAQSIVSEAQQRPLTAEDYRIPLGVERFRCPEILMQPAMLGIDQGGVCEMVEVSIRRLPVAFHEQVMEGTVLLTGGNSLLSGLDSRLNLDFKKCRPLGSTIKVVRAAHALLDAWHGAAAFAASASFCKNTFSKAEYEERGPDWLRKYKISYLY